MVNKRIIFMILAMVLVIALTVGFVFLWKHHQAEKARQNEKEQIMSSDGCHIVDGKLYAHFNGDLYVFDEKTDELEALTSVAMDGKQTDTDFFAGTLSLLHYQRAEEGFIEGTPLVTKEGDFYKVLDQKTCRHNETDEDGNNKMVTHITDYTFTYYVYPEKPEFLAVVIYEHYLDDYHVGILASSEAEAKEGYKWFEANEPK